MSNDDGFSELDDLIKDLGSAVKVVVPNIRGISPLVEKVVEVGAIKVKREWRRNAVKASGKHLKAYPFSIDYDIEKITGGVQAEIGPNIGHRFGVFGAVEDAPGRWRRLGARPQYASKGPAAAAERDLARGVAIAVDQALRGVNL